jgi:ElaB/YqjD/DUF883 family membrane-anchored ribosome-binding protein
MAQTDTSDSEALAAELRRVVEEAEELLGSAADSVTLGALRDRVTETIGLAREKLSDLEQEARQRGRRAAAATETWVRTNPWAALAIGAGIGLIAGALIMRGGSAPEPEEPEL